ncbi:MAG TPA: hypothetical protein VN625_06395 [Desulfuromonadaceae bacterium]|nr:hypothetical protein [Desulfuromonadaceae bacterium]
MKANKSTYAAGKTEQNDGGDNGNPVDGKENDPGKDGEKDMVDQFDFRKHPPEPVSSHQRTQGVDEAKHKNRFLSAGD